MAISVFISVYKTDKPVLAYSLFLSIRKLININYNCEICDVCNGTGPIAYAKSNQRVKNN